MYYKFIDKDLSIKTQSFHIRICKSNTFHDSMFIHIEMTSKMAIYETAGCYLYFT